MATQKIVYSSDTFNTWRQKTNQISEDVVDVETDLNNKIGSLPSLITSNKSSVVGAINEVANNTSLNTSGSSNGDILAFDSTQNKFVPKSPDVAIASVIDKSSAQNGYLPVFNSTTNKYVPVTPSNAIQSVITSTGASNNDVATFDNTAGKYAPKSISAIIDSATSKTTPVDADELALADSQSAFSLKKLTWANLKATLATWINSNSIAAYFTSLQVSGSASFNQPVTVGTATSSNHAAQFNQIGNYNGIIGFQTTGTLSSSCWGKVIQAAPGATLTLPATDPVAGSKVLIFGMGSFTINSNANQFIYSPPIGLTAVTGPTSITISDGGWIELTSRGNGEYNISNGSLLIFKNTSPSFTNGVSAPSFTASSSITTSNLTASGFVDFRDSVVVINANTTAVKSKTYVLDAAGITLALPTSPIVGDWVRIVNMNGGTTSVVSRNGQNIMGLAEDMTIDFQPTNFRLVYVSSTYGWVIA
jgi:hypothetical protein